MATPSWLRFNLRTLLMVALLVGLSLAWWRDREALRRERDLSNATLAALRRDRELSNRQQQRQALPMPGLFDGFLYPRSKIESVDDLIVVFRTMDDEVFARESEPLAGSLLADESLGAIAELVADPEIKVRRRVATFLSQMSSPAHAGPSRLEARAPRVIPLLAKLLNDSDRDVLSMALQGLGRFGPAAQHAAPAIDQLSKNRASAAAVEATLALQHIFPDQDLTPRLIELLSNKDMLTRQQAVTGLEKRGTAVAKHALVEAFAREENADVRDALARAIARMELVVEQPASE